MWLKGLPGRSHDKCRDGDAEFAAPRDSVGGRSGALSAFMAFRITGRLWRETTRIPVVPKNDASFSCLAVPQMPPVSRVYARSFNLALLVKFDAQSVFLDSIPEGAALG